MFLSFPPSPFRQPPHLLDSPPWKVPDKCGATSQSPFLSAELSRTQVRRRILDSAEALGSSFTLKTSSISDVRPPKGVQNSLYHPRGGIIIIQSAHRGRMTYWRRFNSFFKKTRVLHTHTHTRARVRAPLHTIQTSTSTVESSQKSGVFQPCLCVY